MQECKARIARVRQDGKYYIPQEDLSGFPLLDVLFRPVASEPLVADAAQTDALAVYLQGRILRRDL